MIKTLLSAATILGATTLLTAQSKLDNQVVEYFEAEKFGEIVKKFAPKAKKLDAQSLYLVGNSYLYLQDLENALLFMNHSISKSNKNANPYLVKADIFEYINRYDSAIANIEKAIALDPNNAESHRMLANNYLYSGNYQMALKNLYLATEMIDCPRDVYFKIGITHYYLKQYDEAWMGLDVASQIYRDSPDVMEQIVRYQAYILAKSSGNEKAIELLKRYINEHPGTYELVPDLIQQYYAIGDEATAQIYINSLYYLNAAGQLQGMLADGYCKEVFEAYPYEVRVIERFEEATENSNIFSKHIFYVMDEAENVVLKVQTEYSPIAREMGNEETYYFLVAVKGKNRINRGIIFPKNLDYSKLKARAIDLIYDLMRSEMQQYAPPPMDLGK